MDLPDHFDVIIYGTGLIESILSAAFSRAGLAVLHLDSATEYGGSYCSMNLKRFVEWLKLPIADNTDMQRSFNEIFDFPIFTNREFVFNNEVFSDSASCKLSSEQANVRNYSHDNDNVPVSDVLSSVYIVDDDSVKDFSENVVKAENTIQQTCESNDLKPITDKDCENVSGKKDNTNEHSLFKKSRMFNIDLFPKLILCAGDMASILASSAVASYLEFTICNRILAINSEDYSLFEVPFSRSDIFKNRTIGHIEKRSLKHLSEVCTNYDEDQPSSQTFDELIGSAKFTTKMKAIVSAIKSIARIEDNCSALEGVEKMRVLIDSADISINRFGASAATPFFSPLYGVGDIPQAFCRASAVFGGTFCLGHPIKNIVNENGEYIGITDCDDKFIKSKWCVINASFCTSMYNIERKTELSKAVLITNKSILSDKERNNLSVLSMKKNEFSDIVSDTFVIELPPGSLTCPKDYYLLHFTSISVRHTAKEDLSPVIDKLFPLRAKSDDYPCASDIVFKGFYNQIVFEKPTNTAVPSNICVVTDSMSIDMNDIDRTVKDAEGIFQKICPESEFLPTPPRQEDIIFGDEGQSEQSEQSSGG